MAARMAMVNALGSTAFTVARSKEGREGVGSPAFRSGYREPMVLTSSGATETKRIPTATAIMEGGILASTLEKKAGRKVEWDSRNGNIIRNLKYGKGSRNTYDLFLPANKECDALMLFVHGGSWMSGKKEDIEWAARRYAKEGYVSATINYSRAGKDTLNLDGENKSVTYNCRYIDSVENTDTEEGMDAGFNVLNPYYVMFCDTDMDKYPEVLMWREYIEAQGLTHNIQMQLQRNGGGSGWTRGLVNSFVMRNGLPIYAAGSGYDAEWEKEGVTATLQDRDARIQVFTKQDGDIDMYSTSGDVVKHEMHWLLSGTNETRIVTGYAIKKGKHYNGYMQEAHHKGTTGSIVFRGTEALLNYMEACVEKTGAVDGTADKYWRALRKRALVNEDYMVTVNATDLNKEAEGDWGVYSKGQQVSSLLYNVRRERRNEFIGEGMRWADLKRWRALDQVKNYQVSGMRYWGSIYDGAIKDADGNNRCVVDVAGGTGNMSPESDGVYVLPNRITSKNNLVYEGYNWCEAHYLNPLAQNVFRQTASGDKTDLNTSNIYQNPGWPMIDGQAPTGF